MRKYILPFLACFVFLPCIALFGEHKPDAPDSLFPNGFNFNAEFSDEFENGFDSSRWNDFYPTWNGRAGMFHFARKNISVRDGMLVLTARKENPRDVSPELIAEGKENFSTAAFRSKKRILYGYFEVKFKAMDACVCNAFWLNDPLDPPKKYTPGDFIEEIDIFEVFGKSTFRPSDSKTPPNDRIYFTTTHRAKTPYVESKVWLGREVKGKKTIVAESFSKKYHTAGLLWTPEKLVWVLDGRIIDERPNDFCHRPLYINIDCEVMKTWSGEPNAEDLPAEFTVEYLRVWQLGNDSQ